MQFSNVVLAYFIIGAVMWSGGAIDYQDSGVAKFVLTTENGQVQGGATIQDQIESIKASTGLVGTLGGGLLLIWDIVVLLFGFVLWPVSALNTVDAPIEVTVTLGGAFVVAFLMGVLRLIRRGA